MPTPSSRTGRSDSPYQLDWIAVSARRSAAGVLWRWRTELTALTAAVVAAWWLVRVIGSHWALAVIICTAVALAVVPASRRFVAARLWCLLSRHRLQKLCWEQRLHTRSGRLPLILRIRPTKVGERALVWCRAGICAEDFEDRSDQIRAACYAREARITRNPNRSHLVTIDVIRRDTLHAGRRITPRIGADVGPSPDLAPRSARVPAPRREIAAAPRRPAA
jgi:hypothetical protein